MGRINKRKSMNRKSMNRKSMKRKSMKRKSMNRKSIKLKKTKRKIINKSILGGEGGLDDPYSFLDTEYWNNAEYTIISLYTQAKISSLNNCFHTYSGWSGYKNSCQCCVTDCTNYYYIEDSDESEKSGWYKLGELINQPVIDDSTKRALYKQLGPKFYNIKNLFCPDHVETHLNLLNSNTSLNTEDYIIDILNFRHRDRNGPDMVSLLISYKNFVNESFITNRRILNVVIHNLALPLVRKEDIDVIQILNIFDDDLLSANLILHLVKKSVNIIGLLLKETKLINKFFNNDITFIEEAFKVNYSVFNYIPEKDILSDKDNIGTMITEEFLKNNEVLKYIPQYILSDKDIMGTMISNVPSRDKIHIVLNHLSKELKQDCDFIKNILDDEFSKFLHISRTYSAVRRQGVYIKLFIDIIKFYSEFNCSDIIDKDRIKDLLSICKTVYDLAIKDRENIKGDGSDDIYIANGISISHNEYLPPLIKLKDRILKLTTEDVKGNKEFIIDWGILRLSYKNIKYVSETLLNDKEIIETAIRYCPKDYKKIIDLTPLIPDELKNDNNINDGEELEYDKFNLGLYLVGLCEFNNIGFNITINGGQYDLQEYINYNTKLINIVTILQESMWLREADGDVLNGNKEDYVVIYTTGYKINGELVVYTSYDYPDYSLFKIEHEGKCYKILNIIRNRIHNYLLVEDILTKYDTLQNDWVEGLEIITKNEYLTQYKDPYRILGIDVRGTDRNPVTETMITKAYKKKAKELHPDKHQNHKEYLTKKFKVLNRAKEILLNPIEKNEYDRHGFKDSGHYGLDPDKFG